MGLKQAIIVRTDLGMGKGKIAAQCAHASVSALEKADGKIVEKWSSEGAKKVVLKVGGKKELLNLFATARRFFPTSLIKDAGLTQVKPGEATCIAIGPVEEAELDKLTGELKLL